MSWGGNFDLAWKKIPVGKEFKKPEELVAFVEKETKFYKWFSGYYSQIAVLRIKKDGSEKTVNVTLIKGKYPPMYTPEERQKMDFDKLGEQPANILWDGEWNEIKPEDFPMNVMEVILPFDMSKVIYI